MSLYEELEVPRNASQEDIKKAFRKLALLHHPDKVDEQDKAAAEIRFKRINEAYAVLSDENQRRFYDQTGQQQQHHQQHGGGGVPPDIHEFMRNMFGGAGGPFFGHGRNPFGFGQQQQQPPGIDLIKVVVSPIDVFKGLKKSFRVELNVDCSECSGRGAKEPSHIVNCNVCQGTGMMFQKHGPMEFRTTCPACGGKCKGIVPGKGCSKCSASGLIKHQEEFTLDLTPGFQDHSEVELRGRGNKNKDAVERNTVKIVTEMRWPDQDPNGPVKDVRLSDNALGTVHVVVEVGLYELLKGAHKGVDLYGTGDLVPIIAMDCYRDPTRQIVLPGYGLPRRATLGDPETRGDLTISYIVKFPPDGSTEAQNLVAL